MHRLSTYDLLARIASGGMAEIWVARRAGRAGEPVCVIKRLLPQHAGNEEFERMFLEEGRIGAALVHPNVVRTFAFGTEPGSTFIAMEYLHGEDLRAVLRVLRTRGLGIPLAQAVDVIARACAGLHHAHEARGADGTPLQIVHRDVSPHNVLLTFDGQVKVVDFGIAKSAERRWETKHGTLKGKVPYMSPEQIKARRLDRRTDIYAMGVMLYELVLGRRPYVLSSGGDFAMMMAIARHDIRPPREVMPDIDPELEGIILRAMSYDPKARWSTMLEMQLALEKYGARHPFDSSKDALARYLETLFGERIDAWRNAQADLVAHVVQVEEERAQSQVIEDEDGDEENDATLVADRDSTASHTSHPDAEPPSTMVAITSQAIGAVVEMLGLTVVTLQGKIDETFEGAAIGGSLSGTVLVDMKRVERISSFGVREWLELTKAIDDTEDADVWLARCPEAFVTQMSLVPTFIGRARLLSFLAPFLCNDCGNTFTRSLDCERDAAWFRAEAGAEEMRCPRCGGPAKLDDDPAFLAFAAPHAGVVVPERVRAALAQVEQSDLDVLDRVDKVVTDEETRIRVNRDVDRTMRWNRVLDGIEGRLVVDFHGASRVDDEGATSFARAIRTLGSEVTGCTILEAPLSVVQALGLAAAASPRSQVVSVVLSGRCRACAAARTGIVPVGEVLSAGEAGRSPFVPCRRCNAALDVHEPALAALFARPAAPTPIAPPVAASPAPPGAVGARSAIATVVVLTFLGAVVIGLGAFGLSRGRTRAVAAARATASAPVPLTSADVAKEGSHVMITPDAVMIGVTVRRDGSDADLVRARSEAIGELLGEIEKHLPARVRAASEVSPATTNARDERFVRDVGAFASPERVDVQVDGATVSARYRVAHTAWDQTLAYYGTTHEAFGLVVARALPLRRDGLLVVSADAVRCPGLAPGAVLVSVGGRPASGFDIFPKTPEGRRDAIFETGRGPSSFTLR